MDSIDSEKARRVWQRVQGQRPPEIPSLSLEQLVSQTIQLSRLYLRYAEQVYGAKRNRLQQMAHHLQNQARQLKQSFKG